MTPRLGRWTGTKGRPGGHLPEFPSENVGRSQHVNGGHHLPVRPDTSRSQPASRELANGVSNFNGREVGEVNDPQPYLTVTMNEM